MFPHILKLAVAFPIAHSLNKLVYIYKYMQMYPSYICLLYIHLHNNIINKYMQ